jgi:hypothetical protein
VNLLNLLLGDGEEAGDHEVEGGEGDQGEEAAPPVQDH